jgi:hypothetical protein
MFTSGTGVKNHGLGNRRSTAGITTQDEIRRMFRPMSSFMISSELPGLAAPRSTWAVWYNKQPFACVGSSTTRRTCTSRQLIHKIHCHFRRGALARPLLAGVTTNDAIPIPPGGVGICDATALPVPANRT